MFSLVDRQPRRSLCRNNYNPATLTSCSQLNLSGKHYEYINRAGIIPFTIHNGKLYLCLGKHRRSGELTDFAGQRHNYETILECAVREANEETRYAFGELRVEDLLDRDCVCLFNNKMAVIFVYVKSMDENITIVSLKNFNEKTHMPSRFLNRKLPSYFEEISSLHWLDENDIMDCFSPEPKIKLYAVVRRFLMSSDEFSVDVTKMKNLLLGLSNQNQKLVSNQSA